MEPAQHIAFLSAQLAQTKASLRYQTACADAAERRLRAFERTRIGGFMGPTPCGVHNANHTPLKDCAPHQAYGSPMSIVSDNASTQPYGSPNVCCVTPQDPCSRGAHAVHKLRQDAEDVEGLQREVELHTTISPDFLAKLQQLWRNYTEATDKVIGDAISKAKTEGVRQALEGLRKELRKGSVYPTYELARSGPMSRSPCLPVRTPIQIPPVEASKAAHPPSITTHLPGIDMRSPSSTICPPHAFSEPDITCSPEPILQMGRNQSMHASPLFLVERRAAEAAAAMRACRPHAISEPDIDQAAPYIASGCMEFEALRKAGQKEYEASNKSGNMKQKQGPGAAQPSAPACVRSEGPKAAQPCAPACIHSEGPGAAQPSAPACVCSEGPKAAQPCAPACIHSEGPGAAQPSASVCFHSEGPGAAQQSATSHTHSEGPRAAQQSSSPACIHSEGPGAAQPCTPACLHSHGSAQFEDVSDAAAPDTPTRFSSPTQATRYTTCSRPAPPQPHASTQLHVSTQPHAPTQQHTQAQQHVPQHSVTTAACTTMPSAKASTPPHAPRPSHHHMPSFSCFLSPVDSAQPDRPASPRAAVYHTKACQTECCFGPEALALDELIQGRTQALPRAATHETDATTGKLEHPSLPGNHMQSPSPTQNSRETGGGALEGEQQPLQGQMQPVGPCKHVQQQERGSASAHHGQHVQQQEEGPACAQHGEHVQQKVFPTRAHHCEHVQQQEEGSASAHHKLHHLLATLHKKAQLLPAQQRGCTPVEGYSGVLSGPLSWWGYVEGQPQPQQLPHLSILVMQQLMGLGGCKESWIGSHLASALLSRALHLRVYNTPPDTQAGATAAASEAAGTASAAAGAAGTAEGAPLHHHLTHMQLHGHAHASTLPSPNGKLLQVRGLGREPLQVRGLGSGSHGMRPKAKGSSSARAAATAKVDAAKSAKVSAACTGGAAAHATTPFDICAVAAGRGVTREALHAAHGFCQLQDVSRLLGIVAALHHLRIPWPGFGDHMQRGSLMTGQSESQPGVMDVSDVVRAIDSRVQPDAWMAVNLYNLIHSEKARGSFSIFAQQLESWESIVELTLRCMERGGVDSSLTEAFYEVMISVLAITGQRGEEQVSVGLEDSSSKSSNSSSSSSSSLNCAVDLDKEMLPSHAELEGGDSERTQAQLEDVDGQLEQQHLDFMWIAVPRAGQQWGDIFHKGATNLETACGLGKEDLQEVEEESSTRDQQLRR